MSAEDAMHLPDGEAPTPAKSSGRAQLSALLAMGVFGIVVGYLLSYIVPLPRDPWAVVLIDGNRPARVNRDDGSVQEWDRARAQWRTTWNSAGKWAGEREER